MRDSEIEAMQNGMIPIPGGLKSRESSCVDLEIAIPMGKRNVSIVPDTIDEEYLTRTIDDFELIRELDKGSYGNVWLAKEISND